MEMRLVPLKHPGVFQIFLADGTDQLATRNLDPGRRVYDESLFTFENVEYRTWNPHRSKIAAAIRNNISGPLITPGQKVLYLGAASGTTVSHVSDILGALGTVFAVEFSPRSIKDMVPISESRENLIPILADARQPEAYAWQIESVDTIYQDVAQPDQAEILAANARMFLKPGGRAIIAIKSRSIDVTKSPREVYQQEIEMLKELGFEAQPPVDLSPYTKDHVMVVSTWAGKA